MPLPPCPDDDKARVTGLDKLRVVAEKGPNIGIVTAYNDMLSAHAPLQHYPELIKPRPAATVPRPRWPVACPPCATA
jgi:dihydroxyacid dehydratase/phosphogluconate dehydratase